MSAVTKSPEQLSYETTTLFEKLDQQSRDINNIHLQLVELKGNVASIITLMEQSLNKTPSTLECNARYQNVVEKLAKMDKEIEEKAEKSEFYSLKEDLRTLKIALWAIMIAFLTPIAGFTIYRLFGGPLVI